MSFKCAEQFVEEMKSNPDLRKKMSKIKTCDSLKEVLKSNGFDFNHNDLTKAMAACMSEMADSGCGAGQECSDSDFKMDETIQTLIAIGAAAAANCVPCIEHLYYKSGSMGINENLIQEAVDIGSKVKTGASLAIKSTIKELMSGEVEAEQKECCTKASCC
jgi:predicted ribosomally synthesized peptide with nif11-like leader